MIYDEAPKRTVVASAEPSEDFVHINYEDVYLDATKSEPSMTNVIEKIRLIKPPQHREICTLRLQVEDGNQFARTRMIEMHLRLALRISLERAKQFDLELQELFPLACIGLITAVDRYGIESKGAFSSYASLWILQHLSREQPTQNPTIYFPFHKKEESYSLYPKLKDRLLHLCPNLCGNDEALSMTEEILSCDRSYAVEMLLMCSPSLSVEEISEDADTHDWYSGVTEFSYNKRNELFDDIAVSSLQRTISKILTTLTPKERDVIVARYGLLDGEVETLEEVGETYDVTRERVRQIEKKAFNKLSHVSRQKYLTDY